MADYSDAFENKHFDFLNRGQSLVIGASTATWNTPPTYYYALLTTLGTDAGGEVEVTGGAYARVGLLSSLANIRGTDGNTTGASTGTDGTGENAVVIQFPTPTANWGNVVGFARYDALTAGGLIDKTLFSNGTQTINTGNNVKFDVGAMALQVDN